MYSYVLSYFDFTPFILASFIWLYEEGYVCTDVYVALPVMIENREERWRGSRNVTVKLYICVSRETWVGELNSVQH